jgi:hypothetical protein|eukprot:SAG25_NODE_294_length_10260_cov_64.173211_2_plen_173_part_00
MAFCYNVIGLNNRAIWLSSAVSTPMRTSTRFWPCVTPPTSGPRTHDDISVTMTSLTSVARSVASFAVRWPCRLERHEGVSLQALGAGRCYSAIAGTPVASKNTAIATELAFPVACYAAATTAATSPDADRHSRIIQFGRRCRKNNRKVLRAIGVAVFVACISSNRHLMTLAS